MKLKFYPYTIQLKDQFTISSTSRTTTPAMMVEIDHDGIVGFGEASLPQYLKENQQSVINFLEKVNLSAFSKPNDLNTILDYIDNLSDGNYAAKASVDIALHDLIGKIKNIPVYKYLGIIKRENIYSSYTIGIADEETIRKKIFNAYQYKFLKIKLGTDNDKKNIELINTLTDKPLFVDVNQGWKDEYFALDMINWLAEKNVILVEQPLAKNKVNAMKWLNEKSSLPIIADEAVQTLEDLQSISEIYSGVNIKLMKSGGIRNALRMIGRAKELKLKIMLGCMTETSCAITAAAHLASLANWVDLDGAELISNDLFIGMKLEKGCLTLPDRPGLGIEKI